MGPIFRVGMLAGKGDLRVVRRMAWLANVYFKCIISLGFAQSDEQQKELPYMTALQSSMERAMGIEPTSRAWEVAVQILEDDMPVQGESLKPLLYKRFKDFSF